MKGCPEFATQDLLIIAASQFCGGLSGNNVQVARPGWFTDAAYPSNATVARLRNASGFAAVGPHALLKVMAGDQFNLRVAAGYASGSPAPVHNQTALLNTLLSVATNTLAAASGGKATAAALQSTSMGLSPALSTVLSQQPANGSHPRAYLAWILFDEQFKIAATGATQVTNAGTAAPAIVLNNVAVGKSGYLYVYTSNESSNVDVFFDNLQVTHTQGPLLEETHYYPFGLAMSGISSKAAGIQENRYKYNTWERNQDLSLEIDESFYRSNDYQTGRFWQVDPKTENMEMWSPYASNYDNPIRYNDPKGDQPGCCEGDPIVVIGQLARDFFDNGVVPAVAWVNRNVNPVFGFANGLKILATGSNIDGEQRSSAAGVTELFFVFVPGASLEKAGAKQVERKIVQEGGETLEKKAVENVVEVGKYKDVKNAGHHVYQEAAVKNLPGYKSAEAIAVKVEGSGFKKGTQHYLANQVQKMPGGGTLGRERAIAYKALRAMGFTVDQSKQIVRQADKYFESLGFNLSTPTRIPANRK